MLEVVAATNGCVPVGTTLEMDRHLTLEPHSRFGDTLTLIPSILSPKRECGPKGVNAAMAQEHELSTEHNK